MKNPKKSFVLPIITGLFFMFFIISLSVVVILNFRPLYYLDIKLLAISETTGLSVSEIKSNYNALITYNTPFFSDPLVFPTLPSSNEGLIHFKEVKQIFLWFYYLIPASLLFLVPLLYLQRKKQALARCLKISSILTLVLPIIIGIGIAVNFDTAFVLFHKVFFRNDYWIFDPNRDPIINLLPDTFFLHCAIGIILLVLLGSFLLFFFSKRVAKRESQL